MVVSVWKHFLTHLTTHWIKKTKKKNKDLAKDANGHFWPSYPDAHFGHHCQKFSKPSTWIFLHGLQDHIKVIILMLANLAETFLNDYNKKAKWQSASRNKIKLQNGFSQTNFFWQTKNTQRCLVIWASHPKKEFSKFKYLFMRPFHQTGGVQNQIKMPYAVSVWNQVCLCSNGATTGWHCVPWA